jgi:site-specific DNA-methyltransferase (adenine-specific)
MSERLYLNADCMNRKTGLPSYPDNYFDLAIVDPPFGIGEDGGRSASRGKLAKAGNYISKDWDSKPPSKAYFRELMRVSKNQIIWGANHFISRIPFDSSCWIVWDKMNDGTDFADYELAWTSFDTAVRQLRFMWRGMMQGKSVASGGNFRGDNKNNEQRIHPTQKPEALYRWLLSNYARHGMRLLDTHVGSASSLVVFEEMGFDYVAFEKDKDYYADSTARLDEFRRQGSLFSGKEIFEASAKQTTIFDGQ